MKKKAIFFKIMMRLSAFRADKLIAVSQSTCLDMSKLLNVPIMKISVILSAANPIYRQIPDDEVEKGCQSYNLRKNSYLLFVGALEPRKNIPVLIKAYSKLITDFPDLLLVIVGKKGWMYDSIFNLVTLLNLQNHIKFLGYVPESDLVALYNGARLFVYPSAYEGFGFPILEAMQCGTAVITSNISSMPELASDAALLVKPGDVEDLFFTINLVLKNDILLQKLSEKSLVRATKFSWLKTAQQTIHLYETLLKSKL